jgi:hypothetical protein
MLEPGKNFPPRHHVYYGQATRIRRSYRGGVGGGGGGGNNATL